MSLPLPEAVAGLSCLSCYLSVCCLSCLRVNRQGQEQVQQLGEGKDKNHWPWGRGKDGNQGQGGVVKIVEEGRVGEKGNRVAWNWQ